jgi:phenylacetyl-CoA:acceptor oxidoreductase subunit 2
MSAYAETRNAKAAGRGGVPRPAFTASPAQQGAWDARAAANFICGGAGGGLIIVAALADIDGTGRAALLLAGLALIGAGLASVWHELGRPRRALNVFFHPRTSWMSREAVAATLLVPATIGAAAGVTGCAWASAALALAFVFCQARMLQAARGIPAWREPLVVPLLVLTGLVEGAGFFLAASTVLPTGNPGATLLLGTLALLRVVAWLAYRRAIAPSAPPVALRALVRAGRTLQYAGTLLPLALIACVASGWLASGASGVALAVAGLAAAAGGGFLKYTLVLRAGFTQGFALAHRPVRGARI